MLRVGGRGSRESTFAVVKWLRASSTLGNSSADTVSHLLRRIRSADATCTLPTCVAICKSMFERESAYDENGERNREMRARVGI
jgi:hypothetical protein